MNKLIKANIDYDFGVMKTEIFEVVDDIPKINSWYYEYETIKEIKKLSLWRNQYFGDRVYHYDFYVITIHHEDTSINDIYDYDKYVCVENDFIDYRGG